MNWRVYEQNIKNRIAEAEIELKELKRKVANCELRLQLANEEKEAFDKAFEEIVARGDWHGTC
ncbi:hypothetical protein [Fictibacillus gelatini]|uniref:hypothetical protein n=1 Tax=Fictibacillus gelatini TaxID=225985 RepID=UPI0004281A65|nr:hypothetical protein [Fictibacillus gelatini]